jgi:FAD/FMN-containing dehydrogenase/Fe-S oxidoreductase
MNQIEDIGESTVRVQTGVILERLNRELRKYGRYFAPDPSSYAVTSIGGMMGVDSTGSRAIRVGSTRDHIVNLEMVLAGGHVLDCGIESLDFSRNPGVDPAVADDPVAASQTVQRTIVSKLAKLLADNRDLINERQPALIRNSSGYYLRNIRQAEELHLARMLVGSEGTLGLFTSATLHTSPLPEFRGVALLLFGKMEHAIDAVLAIIPQQPSACDLIDRRLLMLGRENDSRFEQLIPPGAEAGLLVEQTGFSEQQTRDRIEMAIAASRDKHPDAVVACEAYSFDDVEFLWELPHKVVSMLARMKGETRPMPLIEDIAIPPEALAEFFVRSQRVLQKHEVTASLYSHAASGQIHMRPFMDVPRPSDSAKIGALVADMNELVFSLGGTISGEHGDGLSRSVYVRDQYGPLYQVFRQIKEIFDPHNLMNPGKIVTEETVLPLSRLRPESQPGVASELVQLQLNWSAQDLAEAADTCNGCGVCRTQHEDMRMCPFFHIEQQELASPRAKANAFRSLIQGKLTASMAASPELQELAALCFNCKQCELECPTNAKIPQLMIEAKAQTVEAGGLDRTTWILSRAHSFGPFGCRWSRLMNGLMKSPIVRWLIEKTIGIHRKRKLPKFARRSLLNALYAGEPDDTAPRSIKGVAYFVDHFANFHDTELAEAFLGILDHNGIEVQVPRNQIGSGMAMVSAGDLVAARRVAETNVRELAELARERMPILCTEPAAALCLQKEYPLLFGDDNEYKEDVQVVADQTRDAGDYLLELHLSGKLKTDFQPLPLRIGYHTPCHLKALEVGTPLRTLMGLIPELDVMPIEKGCSGMAGTFGLSRQHFETSMQIGIDLIDRMREPDLIAGATECSSCRIQMEQGTKTPTLHPIKILAAAYGLLPKLYQQLLRRADA